MLIEKLIKADIKFTIAGGLKYFLCAFFVLITLFPISSPAQDISKKTFIINELDGKYPVGFHLEYLIDKEKKLSFKDITSEPILNEFIQSKQKILNLGQIDTDLWLRFSFIYKTNSEDTGKELYVELGYPPLHYIELYHLNSKGQITLKKSGVTIPFDDREIKCSNIVFSLKVEPNKIQTLYFKIKTQSSMVVPITLWQPKKFLEKISQDRLFRGVYYGLMLAMLFYNLFLYMSVRDESYLYYIFYVIASILAASVAFDSIIYELLSPYSPNASLIIHRTMPVIMGITMVAFTFSFLNIKQTMPKIYKFLYMALIYCIVLLYFNFFISNIIAMKLVAISIFVIPILLLVAGINGVIQGFRPARFYLLAWIDLIICSIILGLRMKGFVPINFFTENIIALGSSTEVILISLALADRINFDRAEKIALKQQALDAQILAVENLKRFDKLKDEFLSNTSHELRTPLNGIIGLAESLIDGAAGKLSDNAKYILTLIVSSGKRLANLVNDILDFSKLRNKELVLRQNPVDIKQLAEVILMLSQPFISDKKLTLNNKIPNNIPFALGDENRIQQILYNIIGNAIKFTETGEVNISAKFQDGMIEISVSDTGIGIPKEKQETIFQSFEQADGSIERKYGGTGLGLAITKSLIELQGGKIWVKSEMGKGSIFSFTLPSTNEKPEINKKDIIPKIKIDELTRKKNNVRIYDINIKNDQESELGLQDKHEKIITGDFKGLKVFAIDDESINLQVIKNNLMLVGIEVETSISGFQAFEQLKHYKPDIILLDVMMPNMNGYEVCAELRKIYPANELPVIMLTAKNQVSDLVEGLESGANDYVTKPFSKNELIARIYTHYQLAKINIAIGRFVPRQFLTLLDKKNIVEINLGQQIKKNMTILFTDIRSFTNLSEQMEPEENFNFLNSYLEKIGPVIREYNGFIDKYMGDAVMALFPERAEDAIKAAIAIKYKLNEFNQNLIQKNQKPIEIGIGIHTGSLMIGIIGEQARIESTVISDAVNLASRLEGLTKIFGARTIVSDSTLYSLADPTKYNYRFLERVKVKGKKDSVAVFEVFDTDPDDIKEKKKKSMQDFDAGISFYYNQRFQEASKKFEDILKFNPDDKATARYFERCQYFKKYGVLPEWDGIEVFDIK
ncbi:MAG: response regulator [Desulfobacterales bacterium]|nr:response regulator [Desulfobacterales bacterium]